MFCKIIIVASFIVIPTIFYFGRIHDSCAQWGKGIGNLALQNPENECEIDPPNY